jgi:hydroxymethylpyrimidine/phosphomethylpyrimidine kinase
VRAARTRVCALSIAGLDPGGGAGILADARAFSAAGAFACAVVAVDTVQSIAGLVRAWPRKASEIIEQAEEVRRGQRLGAVKIGALGNAANVGAVARWLREHPELPVVVDPVLAPTNTRGAARSRARARTTRLADDGALAAMRDTLLPQATLVTANVSEAESLTGLSVTSVKEATAAGRALVAGGVRAALVKGGHLTGAKATDVLVIGDRVTLLTAPRLVTPRLHGGGCTLAALIAGRLAVRGTDHAPTDAALLAAVRWAKRVHHTAIAGAIDVGADARVLDPVAGAPSARAARPGGVSLESGDL